MTNVQLRWIACNGGNIWCSLKDVDLSDVTGTGVYIIWAGNTVVRIGQGDIKSRLEAHRTDEVILAYEVYGELLVTWATVSVLQFGLLDGIERYLADTLGPTVGMHFPEAPAVEVNLPFS